jgi:translocation and assembly module TamB
MRIFPRKTWMRVSLVTAVVLLVTLVGLWSWLLHTSSGAKILLEQVVRVTNGDLQLDFTEGDLASGVRLESLDYRFGDWSMSADRALISVDIDLLPPSVEINPVQIDNLIIDQQLEMTGDASINNELSAEEIREIMMGARILIPVLVRELEVSQLSFTRDGTATWQADHVGASMTAHEGLQLHSLDIVSGDDRVVAEGHLDLRPPFDVRIFLEAGVVLPAPVTSAVQSKIKANLAGSIDRSVGITASIEPSGMTLEGEFLDLLGELSWTLELRAPGVGLLAVSPEADVRLNDVQISTSGTLENYQLSARTDLTGLLTNPVQVNMKGNGNLEGLVLDGLDASSPALESSASGEINWVRELSAGLKIRLERLALDSLPEDWSAGRQELAGRSISGEMDLNWSQNSLQIGDARLSIEGTQASLSANILFDPEAGIAEGTIGWRNLSWPLLEESPLISSELGAVNISGSPDDWKVAGDALIITGLLPQGQLMIEGEGDRIQGRIELLEGNILGGQIFGEADFSLQPHPAFSARLESRDINLFSVLPSWPGSVTAVIEAQGRIENSDDDKPETATTHLAVDLVSLTGSLREQALSGSGRIALDADQWSFGQLKLQLGQSTISVDGQPYSPPGMNFVISIDSLTPLFQGAAGTINSHGTIVMNGGVSSLNAGFDFELEARGLQWGDFAIDSLVISKAQTNRIDQGLNVEARAEGLSLDQMVLEEIDLLASGSENHQSATLSLSNAGSPLQATISGQLSGADNLNTLRWQGELSRFEIVDENLGRLNLSSPADLAFSVDRLELDNTCLTLEKLAGSSMCLEALLESGGSQSLSLNLVSIPANLVNFYIDSDLTFSQQFSGSVAWTRPAGQAPSGKAIINITPGMISHEGDEPLVETGAGAIHFDITDGRLTAGTIELPLTGAGMIDVDFSSSGLHKGVEAGLAGSAVIDIESLAALGEIIPYLELHGGRLLVETDLGGTIGNPSLAGRIELSGGEIHNTGLGLKLSDINLSGNIKSDEYSSLLGDFTAGDGGGRLIAGLDLSDVLHPGLEIEVSGQDILLLDVPDVRLTANPDLKLGWRDGVMTVNGSILIPEARISPRTVPSSSVNVSEDVVITTGSLPYPEDRRDPADVMAVKGRLKISLGDNIVLEAPIATIRFDGSTEFYWDNNLLPLATGSYGLSGEIQAFGQRLRIRDGSIRFPDIPADNPHLNIRAEREIYGNSSIRRAGVFVTGTLRRPLSEAYTVPATNRDRAQTLLITGSDFNFEQGSGAVDVGIYIAPRLYISYGIGLFSNESVVSARYDLPRGFGIKLTTGQQENGVDISYTIER